MEQAIEVRDVGRALVATVPAISISPTRAELVGFGAVGFV